MRELDVLGVRVTMPGYGPLLLLQEVDGTRCLPIWIGANEAAAIANALEGVVPPRPLTHDLFVTTLAELGHTAVRGRITSMTDGVFIGELEIDGHVISARPSDLAALAVRAGIPLTCPDELLDQVGVEIDEPDDEVERFREFLDHVNPDDFDEQ
ncbi:MAG TPA: bifunctional nuclease family protein [Propionibacteriaceae bacterium]|nr:bifunctional nuclease family protein [Propionibacteriaceae bacterium]